MQNDAFLFLRILFAGLFIVTLFCGSYLFKNYQSLFGADPDMPSESEGARTYTQLLVVGVWAHAVFLTGAFALLLH